jgi:hypothetical protein
MDWVCIIGQFHEFIDQSIDLCVLSSSCSSSYADIIHPTERLHLQSEMRSSHTKLA